MIILFLKDVSYNLWNLKKDNTLDIIGSSVEEFISELNNIVGCRIVPTTHDEIYKFAKKKETRLIIRQ